MHEKKKKKKFHPHFFSPFFLLSFIERKNSQSNRGEEISAKITEDKSGDGRSERFVVEEKAWSDGNRGGVWKIWGSAGWDTWQPPVAWWRFERRSNLAGYRLPGNAYYRISTGGSKVSACQPFEIVERKLSVKPFNGQPTLSRAQIIARKFRASSTFFPITRLFCSNFRDTIGYGINFSTILYLIEIRFVYYIVQ